MELKKQTAKLRKFAVASVQRGALLMAALVLVIIIAVMVAAMSFLSVSNIGASSSHLSSAQALSAARAGLEWALYNYKSACTTPTAFCTTLNSPPYSTSKQVCDGTNCTATYQGSFILSGILYPSGAIASTLTGAGITTTTALGAITVSSIANFAPHGSINIDSEEIDYSKTSNSAADCGTAPCFISWKRGANGTTAATHSSGAAVTQPTQCLVHSVGTAGVAQRTSEATVE